MKNEEEEGNEYNSDDATDTSESSVQFDFSDFLTYDSETNYMQVTDVSDDDSNLGKFFG